MKREDSIKLQDLKMHTNFSYNIASGRITSLRVFLDKNGNKYKKQVLETLDYLKYFLNEKYSKVLNPYDSKSKTILEEYLNRLDEDLFKLLGLHVTIASLLKIYTNTKFGKKDKEFCEYIKDMKGDTPYDFSSYLEEMKNSTKNLSTGSYESLEAVLSKYIRRMNRALNIKESPITIEDGIIKSDDESFYFKNKILFDSESLFGSFSSMLESIKNSIINLVNNLKELYKFIKVNDNTKDELGTSFTGISIVDAIERLRSNKVTYQKSRL